MFFFVVFFVRHATMLGTESLDGAHTHGTWGNGHKPPGQKTPWTVLVLVLVFVFVIVFVPSGDIFYCSGSRQLNHSS